MKKRVLVTRPLEQNAELLQALAVAGFEAQALPLLQIEAFDELHVQATALIKNTIQRLDEYDHVIFISTNAVKTGFFWIDQYWPQLPVRTTWYGIGKATTTCLQQWVAKVERCGEAMNSESLLLHPQLQTLNHQKILIVRGLGGRSYLREILEQRGAKVDYCEVYQRQPVLYTQQELAHSVQQGLSAITASSGETLHLLLEQAVNDGIKESIQCLPIIVPGQRVAVLAKSLGYNNIWVAENAGVDAMLNVCKKI